MSLRHTLNAAFLSVAGLGFSACGAPVVTDVSVAPESPLRVDCANLSPEGRYDIRTERQGDVYVGHRYDGLLRRDVSAFGPPGGLSWLGSKRRCAISESGTVVFEDRSRGVERVYVQDLDQVPFEISRARHPDIDSRGSWLVYAQRPSIAEPSSIFLRRLPIVSGQEAQRLNTPLEASNPFMSHDGRFVAYEAESGRRIMRYDVLSGNNVSVVSPMASRDHSILLDMSYDGDVILFASRDSILSGDLNERYDLYTYKVSTGRYTLVSVNSQGMRSSEPQLDLSLARLSGNAQYVGWMSSSDDFDGPTQGVAIFVRWLDDGQGRAYTRKIMDDGSLLWHIQFFGNSLLYSRPTGHPQMIGLTRFF